MGKELMCELVKFKEDTLEGNLIKSYTSFPSSYIYNF